VSIVDGRAVLPLHCQVPVRRKTRFTQAVTEHFAISADLQVIIFPNLQTCRSAFSQNRYPHTF
jgi:hypothetical protein